MRRFTKLRDILTDNSDLGRKINNLEKKYDQQFKVVFDTIKQLIEPPKSKKKKKIGFE